MHLFAWFAYCVFVLSFAREPFAQTDDPNSSDTTFYRNPVFEPVLADPSVIRVDDSFYAYGTEDNWGEEGGYHLVSVLKSKDLVHWEYRRDAFDKKPDWKPKGGIWAPDVTQVEEEFWMYYSFSTWGDPNPGIGLAKSASPEGPFVDQGAVFFSEEIGVKNSIDPFYLEENGKKYLVWGSFHGLFLTELSPDGKKVVGDKVQIAGNHLEAACIYKRHGFYYLFGSAGTCCEGANSTYRILVGRAEKLAGPYVDKSGAELLDGKSGSLVLKGSPGKHGVAGPGHNAEVITDDQGQDWLMYHGMYLSKPKLANGTNRRALFLDPLIWTEGWPSVADQVPGSGSTAAPVFGR
jgi:arabinan endo-1,5-alpha-L-arabinosidase